MKRSLLFVLITMLFVLTVFSSGYAASAGPIKLNYGNFMPTTIPYSMLAKQFCDEINKRTNGKVQITYYPGGTLLTATKVYDGIVNDMADIGLCHIAYTRGRFPVTETLNLPVGYPSGWIASQVMNDFYDKFKPKEWDAVHVLHFFGPGPQIIATVKKPVKRLEDLKGVKLRAAGKAADVLKALGGTPVAVEMPDIYDGLQRGVVDGTYDSMETWMSWKTGELLRFAADSRVVGFGYPFYIIMNKDKWNSLPDDAKKTFNEVASEWKEKYAVLSSELDIPARDYLRKQGGQIFSLSPEEGARWVKAAEPVIEQHIKDMEAKGFKKADSEAQVKFIKERITHWTKEEKARNIPRAE